MWVWRAAFALAGIAAYWALYPPQWGNPFWLLYDLCGLSLPCALAGEVVGRYVRREARGGEAVRLVVLGLLLVVAWGVQTKGWPFSGHLFCASAAAMLEAGDRRNPILFRLGVFGAPIMVVWVRTCWPQTPMMGLDSYTVAGLVGGGVLGGLGLLVGWLVSRGRARPDARRAGRRPRVSAFGGLSLVAVTLAAGAAWAGPFDLPLEEVIQLEPQSVRKGQQADLALPGLPAKAGKVIVLRFRAVITSEGEGGCNINGAVEVNGMGLGRYTAAGEERLIGREPTLELTGGGHPPFPVFSGDRLMLMYAPTPARGDAMVQDGLGASFAVGLSDVARAQDGNILTFLNVLVAEPKEGFGALRVEDIEVGWLAQSKVPPPVVEAPKRGEVVSGVKLGETGLAQSTRGGFVVRAGGLELLVETGLGMKPEAASVLVADDGADEAPEVKVTTEPWGSTGYRMTATWPGLLLERTVAIGEDLVEWKERWTNTGDATRGVPFRHRLFLRDGVRRFRPGGSEDTAAMASSACNPTLFLESASQTGNGFGITAESDWLRLLLALRCRAGLGELYSDQLALAPKSAIDFHISVAPVRDGGGYWSFINGVRRRQGVDGITQERPVFFGYARAAGEKTPEEQVAKALGHLGPVYVAIGPWQRLEPDARVLQGQGYPKLPEGAARAPGACPDLDVEKWLTFAHREAYWQAIREEAELIRRAAPQAKVMQWLHPAMEVIYRPLEDRWPYASEAIRQADGKVFEDPYYTRAWIGDWGTKDWAVLYYVPRPGSPYLEHILDGVRRVLDECGLDGVYCDEFSWAYNTRAYSRYDYSRWDGYSADLDEAGNVVRLKSDSASATESCQLRMIDMVLRRGRFFLNNGGNALRSVSGLPHARFIEGGGGPSGMGQGHLSPTPLVLGNMGDETTREGVFESVRVCLGQGCLYSPTGVNLLLEGPDNFVSRLYPMTVEEIGPGWIVGRERIATTVSRTFGWPEGGGKVKLYRYDAKGEQLEPATVEAGEELTIKVPEQGLVIAERQ